MTKIIKVKVIKEYIQLNSFLPLGFETELNVKLSSEEKIIPAGNYEGFSFKGLNGKIYDDKTITAAIGYKKINEIFEKI